ncbi:MAG TPA: hypothetical protein VFA67_17140 [Candidatus Sulfotelmatobacter sp.]|nr:hypothetical protein [Candidatus Sulfotelmatobacter sp.]
MYTGTMISDLLMAAQRAAEQLQQQRMNEELHEIFTMQIPVVDSETAYMGAA